MKQIQREVGWHVERRGKCVFHCGCPPLGMGMCSGAGSGCVDVTEAAESICKKEDNHRLTSREKRKG